MEYEYTAINRLQEPHSYMYSQFGGRQFLVRYREDRLSRVRDITRTWIEPVSLNEALTCLELTNFLKQKGDSSPLIADCSTYMAGITMSPASRPSKTFSLDETVDTSALIEFLLATLLSAGKEEAFVPEAQMWIDRLVQRFEVSKKVWSRYHAGFRKGEGSNGDVDLYYAFALLLALAYARSRQLQYLSTLLKVNDLLLSLPTTSHADKPSCSLALSVAIEMCGVRELTPAPRDKHDLVV